MTSQSRENKKLLSSAIAISNNVKVGQNILMKEPNRNDINNKNILLLNRTIIAPGYKLKNSGLVQIASPSTEFSSKSNVSKHSQSGDERFFGSNLEVIYNCNQRQQFEKPEKYDNKTSLTEDIVKKETPLLQIFDGNVVISQELSIEEVQNLLFQINTKLQNQNNVNSTDFPNITFSKEENSDVEIILEEKNKSDERNQISQSKLKNILGPRETLIGKCFDVNDRKVVNLLSLDSEVEKVLNQPSTSSETNLLISFKTSDDRKSESNDFEHDYSSSNVTIATENGCQKATGNSDAELMQIELVEASDELVRASAGSNNCIIEKDGEPIKLPDNLESVPKAEQFPSQRHRWNTNEEIAAILISFEKHNEWQSKEVKIRPKSGSMLLYSRKKVRYRRDGYCWKKRKDGKTTREDHMKLKVQGTECIYGCYVHSAILPTFHRRCYWLLQNPDIVLVHYLNVPYPDDNKLAVLAPSLALWGDKKEWTKEELVCQLKPMFYSEDERDLSNELEISTAETVEAIVTQLMEKQRAARAATLTKQLECGCPDSTCADSKSCSHPMRRITAANLKQESGGRIGQQNGSNQVSSTSSTGTLLTNSNGSSCTTIHHRGGRSDRVHHEAQPNTSPLLLSLSQINTSGGLSLSQIQGGTNLLILNNPSSTINSSHPPTSVAMVTNFKCTTTSTSMMSHQQPPLKQYHHPRNKVILKHESTNSNLSCCRIVNSSTNHKSDEPSRSRLNANSLSGFDNALFSSEKADVEKNLTNVPVSSSKFIDAVENAGDTIFIFNSSRRNRTNSVSSAVSGSSFYNETLDLSQEDIQKTLSANMPLSELTSSRRPSHSKSPSPANTVIPPDIIVPEINPMELIDSPPAIVDDDVFVNLDAFDILNDFPELEVLNHSHISNNSDSTINHDEQVCNAEGNEKNMKNDSSESILRNDFRESSASITDYSPEWAYPEGGVKVLVTGPWYSSTNRYTVLFDSFPVPTTLVQSGVLRCFCPAHEVGLAMVQVACEGFVISNSVMFEYKRPPSEDSIKLKEPKLEENENLLKFTLLQKLEAIDSKLHIKQEPNAGESSDSAGLYHQSINFEERMVHYCQGMTYRQWRSESEPSWDWKFGLKGMTLLHLAASLGYTRLVCTMLHWRAENSSLLLDAEIDALSQDDEGFTPLMWACGRGHRDTAILLYRWNHTALHIHNSLHQTPLGYAKAKGHSALAKELEKLEACREEGNTIGLSTNLDSFGQAVVTPDISPSSSVISLNTNKAHDGTFLRPDPVEKPESILKVPNTSLDVNSFSRSKTPSPTGEWDICEPLRLVKRPSVDSGINLGSGQSDSLSLLRSSYKYRTDGNIEFPKALRFDRSMSLPSPTMSDSYDSNGHRMDFALCEVTAAVPSSQSPTNDVENLSTDDVEVNDSSIGDQEVRVLTLAEQIIAAIPERIKNESEEMQLDTSPPSGSSRASDNLHDTFREPFLDKSSPYHAPEFNFEFSDHSYRYYDVETPSSSLSPGSSSLQSPSPGFPLETSSPPPTTQDFCEFFHASGSIFEKDFSNLTLSDKEQRELYEAAKIIQKAYRSYKGRKKLEEDKERAAAILIQNYYRRYKQFAYFKQMTHAAMVIQNGYRSYCEHKRFKKSQEAAVCIQNYYRHYKEQGDSRRTSRETTPTAGLKRTYSQRRQHQAACKIQQFMRQSKNKLQKERALAAEKERLDVRQSFQDVRRKSQSPDNSALNSVMIVSPRTPDDIITP